MKLYDGGCAPNPRRVRVFLAEKGITIPAEQVDLGALQHRTDAYAAINPMRRVPALALDDGTVITESVAICRYFEALHPDPPLFGRGPLAGALVGLIGAFLVRRWFAARGLVFSANDLRPYPGPSWRRLKAAARQVIGRPQTSAE